VASQGDVMSGLKVSLWARKRPEAYQASEYYHKIKRIFSIPIGCDVLPKFKKLTHSRVRTERVP